MFRLTFGEFTIETDSAEEVRELINSPQAKKRLNNHKAKAAKVAKPKRSGYRKSNSTLKQRWAKARRLAKRKGITPMAAFQELSL